LKWAVKCRSEIVTDVILGELLKVVIPGLFDIRAMHLDYPFDFGEFVIRESMIFSQIDGI